MKKVLKVFEIIGRLLSWFFGQTKTGPVKAAYKKAAEAERGEAVAKEESIRLSQEKASVELAKKDFDEFFKEEDY